MNVRPKTNLDVFSANPNLNPTLNPTTQKTQDKNTDEIFLHHLSSISLKVQLKFAFKNVECGR